MALSVQGLQRASPGPLSETQMRAWVPEQTRCARNSGAPSSQPLSRASVQVMLVQAQAAAGSGSRLAGPMAWGHFIGDKHLPRTCVHVYSCKSQVSLFRLET